MARRTLPRPVDQPAVRAGSVGQTGWAWRGRRTFRSGRPTRRVRLASNHVFRAATAGRTMWATLDDRLSRTLTADSASSTPLDAVLARCSHPATARTCRPSSTPAQRATAGRGRRRRVRPRRRRRARPGQRGRRPGRPRRSPRRRGPRRLRRPARRRRRRLRHPTSSCSPAGCASSRWLPRLVPRPGRQPPPGPPRRAPRHPRHRAGVARGPGRRAHRHRRDGPPRARRGRRRRPGAGHGHRADPPRRHPRDAHRPASTPPSTGCSSTTLATLCRQEVRQ